MQPLDPGRRNFKVGCTTCWVDRRGFARSFNPGRYGRPRVCFLVYGWGWVGLGGVGWGGVG